MHETAYGNSLKKIQHANEKLIELREKITEIRRRAEDERGGSRDRQAVGNVRREPDDRLRRDRERHPAEDRPEPRQGAASRPTSPARASPRSRRRSACRACSPSRRCSDFEVELGLKSPETTPIAQTAKDLGPAAENATKTQTSRPTRSVDHMANGQPRPAFYVAVLLVVLGLVGLGAVALRRDRAGRRAAAVHRRRAEEDEDGRRGA